jgi:hypothetical protein
VRAFADFQKYLVPEETPFTQALGSGRNPWTVPDFCAKTKKQEVQPFFDYYTEIVEILDGVAPDQDEEDWGHWSPSEHYTRLSRLANRVGQLAYQEVDNPAYDEDACLRWKEGNMRTWTKVEWGQATMPSVPPGVKAVAFQDGVKYLVREDNSMYPAPE